MILFLFSIAPVVLFLILLLAKKWPLLWVSLASLVLVFLTTFFYWQIQPIYIFNSFIKGFLVAFDIFIIIFGAIFFLEILQKTGVIENLCARLEGFSKDIRIQVIILAWFLENFIEGTAGFGTPSAVAAPLLVGLGLNPLSAVVMSLLGNSTSVAFGAAGTPIRVGFAGLDQTQIPLYTALFNSAGFLVPVFMLGLLTTMQSRRKSFFLGGLPFAIWSGIAFVVPSILIVPLGQEFPSIIGAVLGLGLVFATTKLGLFVPREIRELKDGYTPRQTLSAFKVFFPYVLLIMLLIVGKFAVGSISLPFSLLGVDYGFSLYNPGFAFLLAAIPVSIFWKGEKSVGSDLGLSLKRTLEPFVIILAMSSLVQLMVNSGNNLSGIPSALEFLASAIKTRALPLIAPFIGAFGSFLTGSATISNIMFGNFLSLASQAVGLNVSKILALQLVGASAGNMIALADMLAAEAVVGIKNQERYVLKGAFLPCLIYVIVVAVVGFLVV